MKTSLHLISKALLLSLVATVFIAGCGDLDDDDPNDARIYEGDDGLTAEVVFDPDPPREGAVDMTIDLFVDGDFLEGADVEVETWMPAHGHGAATDPVVHDEGEGHYRVEDLTFSMPGQWEVIVDVDWEDGQSELVIDVVVEG